MVLLKELVIGRDYVTGSCFFVSIQYLLRELVVKCIFLWIDKL